MPDLALNAYADNPSELLTLYSLLNDSNRPFVSRSERSLITPAMRMGMDHKGIDVQHASTWVGDIYTVLAQELRREHTGTVSIIASTLREHAT